MKVLDQIQSKVRFQVFFVYMSGISSTEMANKAHMECDAVGRLFLHPFSKYTQELYKLHKEYL